MFDSTIRLSVATLGVVAGLLTAAGPASALGTQVGSEGVKPPANAGDAQARVGGKMHLEDVSLGIRGDAQDTQASLGRETASSAWSAPRCPVSEGRNPASPPRPLSPCATRVSRIQ